MVIDLYFHYCGFIDRRNDEHCFQPQGSGDHFGVKVAQIILISPSNLFNLTMYYEKIEHPGEETIRMYGYCRPSSPTLDQNGLQAL